MGCLSPAWTCFSSSNFQTQMCQNLIFCVQTESIFGLCLDILKVAAPTGLRYGERDYKDPVYGGMLLSVAISPLHPKAPQLAVFKAEGRTSDDILNFIFEVLEKVSVFLGGVAAAPPARDRSGEPPIKPKALI